MAGPTIRDVADSAGVSIATVSRALTGQDVVSEETRLRVEAAARSLNYRVNSHARFLRSSRSRTVGLLVSDVRNPFFAHLAHRIQADLAAQGYATFIGSAAEDEDHQEAYLASLLQHRIDGVLVSPQGNDSPVLRQLLDLRIPVVFVDRTLPGFDVPYVDSDPGPGLAQAVTGLRSAGYRRVGFLAGPLNTSTGRDRLTQFQKVAPPIVGGDNVLVGRGGYDVEQVQASLEDLIGHGVDAVIFGYGPNTFTGLRLFGRLDIEPGNDLGVVSFDDIETFQLLDPPVAVISQQVDELGSTAVRMLIELMGGAECESTRVPTSFIFRRSAGTPRNRRGSG